MKNQEIMDGLTALGFTSGYAIGGDPAEIILWENDAKQPTASAIAKAAVNVSAEREAKEAAKVKARESGIKKLAKLGLTDEEIAALLQS